MSWFEKLFNKLKIVTLIMVFGMLLHWRLYDFGAGGTTRC